MNPEESTLCLWAKATAIAMAQDPPDGEDMAHAHLVNEVEAILASRSPWVRRRLRRALAEMKP